MNPDVPFSQAELKRLRELLDQLEKGKDPRDVLLDNADLQQKFKICRRTTYNWRMKKSLKHLYIHKKVFYRLSDVREFIDRNAHE